MKRSSVFLFVIALMAFIPSCKVFYPNEMFQQKDYQFFELARKQIDQYVIQAGDQISVKVYAREGFKLVDVVGAISGQASSGINRSGTAASAGSNAAAINISGQVVFLVDHEGFVKLPIVGELFVKGYTEKELERILSDKYADLFVDPFVMVRVENRRALVFKGSLSLVVGLNDAPTNLLEVIARSGGLDADSKAYNIKIIRGDIKNPEVIVVDLSTLEGMRKADLIIQSNDIIYIQKRKNFASAFFTQFTPYLAFISTITTLIILANSVRK